MPDDLTPEEQQELENIRRRKQELLEDIQVESLLLLLGRGTQQLINLSLDVMLALMSFVERSFRRNARHFLPCSPQDFCLVLCSADLPVND